VAGEDPSEFEIDSDCDGDPDSDMIAAVTINGRLIDNLNLLTDTITLDKEHLKPGANTLAVKLDTTLNNRQNGSGQAHGLTGIELLPYRQTAIDARR
jgi:hypothetical protein